MNSTKIRQFHELALSERDNYIQFIYELGEKKIKMLFKFPGEEFSLWWFSLVAEKSPYKSEYYNKLISFLLSKRTGVEEAAHTKSTAKDSFWFQLLSGIGEFFRFFGKIIYIKSSMNGFNERKKRLPKSDYVIVSYFPFIGGEAARDNIFENRYLGPFHNSLESKLKNGYSHILKHEVIDNKSLKQSVALARRFCRKQSLFFVEEFFKIRHLFLFGFYYLYFLCRFIFNLPVIKKAAVYEHEGSSYNIWHILKRDFYRSFCGPMLVSSIWYILLFKEIVANLKKESKIICICEMQWWERALYIYAAKRNLITIGYQHTIVPELLLNYFNSKNEIDNSDVIKNCPLPDYMATVGTSTAALFKKYGWPKERVFVWGAQRFNSLTGVNADDIPWEDRKDYIVVAFSIDEAEAENILRMLSRAFIKKTKYKIILKGHPFQDLKKVINRMGVKLDSEVFSHADANLADIIRFSKGMIAMESSACFYAVAHGLPIIIPRFMGKIDCSPLSYTTDIPIYTYSPEELVLACEGAISSKPSADYQHRCEKAFKDYFYFPENDDEYLDKILSLPRLKIGNEHFAKMV